MEELDQYILDLENLSQNLDNIIYSVIGKNKGKILSMVKLRLFNKGVDGSGSRIEPQYAPSTIEIKKGKRQRTSHVTLRDSGNLYRSLFVEYKNSSIFIDTNISFKSELIDKYGKEIFDLTIQEARIIIFSFIEPEIQKELKKIQNIDLTNEIL